MKSWLYLKGDKQGGPLSDLGLRDLITRGELAPTDLVWREGMAQWAPAASIDGLVPPQANLPPFAVAIPAAPVGAVRRPTKLGALLAAPPAGPVSAASPVVPVNQPVAYMPATSARRSGMPAWGWALLSLGGAACVLCVVLAVLLFKYRAAQVQAAQAALAQLRAAQNAQAAAQSRQSAQNALAAQITQVPPPPPAPAPQPSAAIPGPNTPSAALDLVTSNDANAIRTEMVGGNGGEPDSIVSRSGMPVLGFRYSLASWGGVIVHKITPLWTRTDADVPASPGSMVQGGYPIVPEKTVMAREGFVVGGIVTLHDRYFRGFQVIFMRYDGMQLHPENQYTSDWCGARAKAPVQLAGHGERVIGVFGRQGLNRDAFGLLLAR